MRFTRRSIIRTNTSLQFVRAQDAFSFGNVALAMNPLGFNRVEPGTFRGQQARQDAHPPAGLLDRLIVAAHPSANHLTLVPRGVIPDQYESRNRLRRQLLATRGQEVDGDRADGTTVDKAQEHLVGMLLTATQQHSITGQGFRINLLFAACEFLQPSHVILIYPAMLIGLSQPTPPDLIEETERPGRMGQHQTDQAIPSGFFPDVVRIRTGDPVFGSFPANAQLAKRIVDGFSAHQSAGDAYLHAHLSCQIERPNAGVFAKVPRTLVQQRTQLFTPLSVEDLMGRVRARGFGLERSQSSLVKIVNGVAKRLIGTADETGNGDRRLSLST